MTCRNLIVAIILLPLAAGCAPPVSHAHSEVEVKSESESESIAATPGVASDIETPWTSLEAKDRPEDFHFVVVTDRTGGAREGVFEGAMDKVNLLKPAFVVSIGDFVQGWTDDRAELNKQWDEAEKIIGKLESPFFYTAGNHDMNSAITAEEWQKRFGASYYHFSYKGVLFLVLNSELFGMSLEPQKPLPGPWTLAEQMRHAESALAEHADARWTVVLMHNPLWDSPLKNHPEWLRLVKMLEGRPHTVFAGHTHRYKYGSVNNHDYITLATTGGVSALRGIRHGEFDHIVMIHIGENGPSIANLELSGILDKKLR